MLDEECIRPGQATDLTFLGRMDMELAKHKHFKSLQTVDRTTRRRQSFKKSSARAEFRIVHYAGTVTYTVDSFLDKNNDLLFRDLKEVGETPERERERERERESCALFTTVQT